MVADPMDGESTLLGQLAEEFTNKLREGHRPDIEEYVRRFPELAVRIRGLFPTLVLLEGTARARATATATPRQTGFSPGMIFGPYRILREIGRGGMGIVYEAVQVLVEKRVALKVLPLQPPADARQLERFFREARITAGLHHPNIVPVLDVGQIADSAYFAMQYIDGHGLDRILRLMQPSEQPPDLPAFTLNSQPYQVLPEGAKAIGKDNAVRETAGRIRAGVPARWEDYLKWVAQLGIQAAAGLAYAHEHKLIHRDIKPSNLLLGKKGTLWIADFGLARSQDDPALTMTGVLLGTPRYMSPEQAEAARRQVDHRSDIYSLGATLYELLTWRPVFEGKTPQEILLAILVRDPVAPRRLRPSIPADLETIVMKAMARRPEDRYQSARALAEDLERWVQLKPIRARRAGPVRHALGWCRRNLKVVAAVMVVATALVIAGSLFYRANVRDHSGGQLPADTGGQSEESHKQTANKDPAPGMTAPIESQVTTPPRSPQGETRPQGSPDAGPIGNPNQPASGAAPPGNPDQTTGIGAVRGQPSPARVPEQDRNRIISAPIPITGRFASGLPLTVKMATLAPSGSPWHNALLEVDQKWRQLSNGLIRITLYADGSQGDDPDVVRKMRGSILQGALWSSVGVAQIEESVYALGIPMAYDSYEEVYAVLERMQPRIESAMEVNGFVVLNWADAGWTRFFATRPVAAPEDLKKLKLCQLTGDAKPHEIWKTAGFKTVPLAYTDILPSLRTGMIEACSISPQVALLGQYYTIAKFMTDMNWTLLLGATVLRKDTWAGIPADIQPALLQAMQEAGAKLQADTRRSEENAIAAMQKRGLIVVPVDAEAQALWRTAAESAYGKIRGNVVPADVFDEALKYRDEYRKQKEVKKSAVAAPQAAELKQTVSKAPARRD
jgi:serine/threonine protein kinase/TRAP-type C4-dicarboxylate transport system substrate-binding protein